MTEAEWIICTNPTPMLEFLRTTGKVSERKLRLFAVAVCRRIGWLLTDERSRTAVEIAERVADGAAGCHELVRACEAASSALGAAAYAADAAASLGGDPVVTAMLAADAAAYATDEQTEEQRHAEEAVQCRLLRDIVGNPFHPASIDPSWLTAPVVAAAKTAYDDRRMPEGLLDPRGLRDLALALEAVGLEEGELLAHLWEGWGPHVRGCWAIDLLLGKE